MVTVIWFQSLFSWMSGLSQSEKRLLQGMPRVSILVFMDVRPQQWAWTCCEVATRLFQSLFSWMSGLSSPNYAFNVFCVEFQSLFSWMSGLSPVRNMGLDRSVLGFNPCFHGCQASAPVALLTLGYGQLFQSLFSWMSGLSWIAITSRRNSSSRFQSLFSWMSGLSI